MHINSGANANCVQRDNGCKLGSASGGVTRSLYKKEPGWKTTPVPKFSPKETQRRYGDQAPAVLLEEAPLAPNGSVLAPMRVVIAAFAALGAVANT